MKCDIDFLWQRFDTLTTKPSLLDIILTLFQTPDAIYVLNWKSIEKMSGNKWTKLKTKYVPTLEVISTEGKCTSSIPPLPKGLFGHKSVYFNGNLWVCGGWVALHSKKSKECMLLKDSNSKWTVGPEMNEVRYRFSMAKV